MQISSGMPGEDLKEDILKKRQKLLENPAPQGERKITSDPTYQAVSACSNRKNCENGSIYLAECHVSLGGKPIKFML